MLLFSCKSEIEGFCKPQKRSYRVKSGVRKRGAVDGRETKANDEKDSDDGMRRLRLVGRCRQGFVRSGMRLKYRRKPEKEF